MSKVLQNIIKNDMCCGCGLCESICTKNFVKIEINNQGFYRPTIKNKISDNTETIISAVCPALVVKKPGQFRLLKTDPIWGDYESVYIATSTNDTIRENSSSGGIISSALIYLLESKQIDAAIHIGRSSEDPFVNAIHLSTTTEDVLNHSNSRYAPAAPLNTILEILESGKKYAFVGKPCDVAALRQLSGINSNVANQVLFYFSFFCAGTPSIKATEKLVDSFKIEAKNVDKIDFRKDGWPGYFKVLDKNGKEYKMSYNDSWGNVLCKQLQVRCKICGDGIGELADITCGDGWSNFDKKGYPTFKNEKGKSIIFSKTLKGEKLLNSLIKENKIEVIEQLNDLRKIDLIQPGQLLKKQFLKARLFAFKIRGISYPVYDSFLYKNANRNVNILKQIKQFLGTLKRII